jgi:CRISPR/Cas system CMR-associated protein Cmr5 small subunit
MVNAKQIIQTEVRRIAETKNLDALINKIGYQIVEKIKEKGSDKTKYKNEIDKALGVLSNDGVYAYYVYVKSKKIDDIFLNEIKPIVWAYCNTPLQDDNWQEFFQNLSEDLPGLLFFREILEKILIYARYHAKAMGD